MILQGRRQAGDLSLRADVVVVGSGASGAVVARELAQRVIAMPPLPVALTKATMRAIKRGSEMGDAVYSDPDLLLYARLLQQRGARRSGADDASRA